MTTDNLLSITTGWQFDMRLKSSSYKRSLHFMLLFTLCFVLPFDGYAQSLPYLVKGKADKAVEQLRDSLEEERDVKSIIPKMKRVEILGKSGKLKEANALLDEILQDFEGLEQRDKEDRKQSLFINDKVVNIKGYDDDAMEAFISRDGRYLFFNSLKTKNRSKDIFYAERIDDYNFRFKGQVKPINTAAVEGVPTMDENGNFFYVSTHAYKPKHLVTMFKGTFNDGMVTNITPLRAISLNKGGWLNMDSEISADGNTLYSTQSFFSRGADAPSVSYFFYAKKKGDIFEPQADSAEIFKNINQDKIVYGTSISKDELELLYTRLLIDEKRIESMRATRTNKNAPFEKPEHIKAITGFSEAPAFGHNEDLIYYHKQSTSDGKFRIHALHRNKDIQ
tara:strand:- start:18771 stop:19949 length:1179 start_codon:yes stop_codon:yes gene_type:complete